MFTQIRKWAAVVLEAIVEAVSLGVLLPQNLFPGFRNIFPEGSSQPRLAQGSKNAL
jgi:hypothetical protein